LNHFNVVFKVITVYEEAIHEYNDEITHFEQLAKQRDQLSKSQAKAALAFLAYLQAYLKVRDFW
jgi:hypothetical protein